MQSIPYLSAHIINLHITKKNVYSRFFNMLHTLNFHIQDREQKLQNSTLKYIKNPLQYQ